MAHHRAALLGALLGTVALQTEVSLADAVPPPPENCRGDMVPMSDHGGPRCVLPAPENCPPGYRGKVGGDCVLHQCRSEEHCAAGNQCLDVQICFEPREVWVEYSEGPVSRDNLLAGPPIPLDEPKTVFEPIGVCQQDGDCESPSECRPGRLCFPRGTAATAAPSRAPGTVPRSDPDRPSGCGKGCATRSSGGAMGAALLLVGVVCAGWARRHWRRRPRGGSDAAR